VARAQRGVRPAGLHPQDEYTLYQALVGAWPADLPPDNAEGLAGLAERVRGYLTKALREGKERSSWLDQDAAYEEAALGFAAALLDPARSRPFLDGLAAFVRRVGPAGEANALAQLLLKLASPGVPDVYQGTELWDLSLVDPDNRRPVDWRRLEGLLEDVAEAGDGGGVPAKIRVMARALGMRREEPELFAAGEYLPLALEGELARHALAFARRRAGRVAVVLVGLRLAGLVEADGRVAPERWGGTALVLPEGLAGAAFEDRLTGARLGSGGGDRLRLRDGLAGGLPVALLVAGAG
jgi:(1->4)-alpha-D-glucan 1-alpha-D-glucosylmutase